MSGMAVRTVRALRTKSRNRLNSLLSDVESLKTSLTTTDGHGATFVLSLMNALFDEVKKLDANLFSHPDLSEEDQEREVDSADSFNQTIMTALAELATIRSRPACEQPTMTSTTFTRRVHAEANSARTRDHLATEDIGATHNAIHNPATQTLPDIPPETFTGDRLKFRQFITHFNWWIATKRDMPPVVKLMALKKYLAGEPKALVDSLELSDANLEVAFDLLEANFTQADCEKQKILRELRSLPKVSNANDTTGLCRLTTLVQRHVRTLSAMGIPPSRYALTLKPALEAALPHDIRQNFKQWRRLQLEIAAQYRHATSQVVTSQLAASSIPSTSPPPSSAPETPSSEGSQQTTEQTTPADRNPKSEADETELERLIEYVRQIVKDREEESYVELSPSVGGASKPVGLRREQFDRRKPPYTIGGVQQQNNATKPLFEPRPCLFCNAKEHNSSRCSAALDYDQRTEILRKLRKCLKCFRAEHTNAKDCKGPRHPCGRCRSPKHYSSMHKDHKNSQETRVSTTPILHQANPVVAVAGEDTAPEGVFVLTASAYLISGDRRIPIRVFLDHGSSLTFLSPNARKLLSNATPVQRAKMKIEAFASSHCITTERFNVQLASTRNDQIIDVLAYEHEFRVNPHNSHSENDARSIAEFNERHPIADRSLVNEWSHSPPALLIGIDQIHKILIHRAPVLVHGDLYAYESIFGWVLGGPTTGDNQAKAVSATVVSIQDACCAAALAVPVESIKNLWRLDVIGITDQATSSSLSADEEAAVKQFSARLQYTGQRYTVSFPKKPNINELKNNKPIAIDRLQKKVKQLNRTPARYQRYHEEIMRFTDEGFATEVKDFDPDGQNEADGSYYMPHHAIVTHDEDRDKWRIVFDCSAAAPGALSLNKYLLPGPNLNPDLVTVLLNFRVHPVVLSADIAKAYMRIGIHAEDRPLFRFLWRPPNHDEIRCLEMTRVTWGAASSGFILAATIREHLRKTDPHHAEELGSHFYADDFLRSFPTVEQAIAFTDHLRTIMGSAGMELAKWKTNEPAVAGHLLSTGVDPASIEERASHLFKVLGIVWSPEHDTLTFTGSEIGRRARSMGSLTKRSILSIVASVYDPLGLLMPFTIRGRKIIQRMWETNLPWDNDVPEDIRDEFLQWSAELEDLHECRIPRQFAPATRSVRTHHLHVFGDASQTAYACVAYLVHHYHDGTSDASLVMAKSRLAPLTSLSLPRLELLASLIATRLKTFLVDRLDIHFEKIHLYTDSKIVYYWVTSTEPGRWKTFVSNRVAEIQRNSKPDEWQFVPGQHNIADFATRGVAVGVLRSSTEWWSGPAWIRSPRAVSPASRPGLEATVTEVVNNEIRHVVASITVLPPLIDLDTCSTIGRAIRIMANVIKFVRLTRRRSLPRSTELAKEAEHRIITWTQQQHLKQELDAIAAGDAVPSKSKLAGFKLFLDANGVLRASTRLALGPMLTYDEKHPVVIPGDSRLATLLILGIHRVNAHFGVSTVLNILRRRFLVIRARQIIKSLLNRCVTCRRNHSRHATQIEAPLPPERVTLTAPFAVAGLDFCGPFFTRVGKTTEKNYVALFTCASTRAIHLEVVSSMATTQTHLALRRFLSQYPACSHIVSDNARSFVKAATDIKRVFNSAKDREVRDLLASRHIKWEFVCPRAPWHGGFYERLVGTVKKALTHLDRTNYFKGLCVRWYRDYLLQLKSAAGTHGKVTEPIRQGDVCILREDNVPRIRWNLVRVEEAHPGRDGRIRTYSVRFASGRSSRRAAQLLYPLEVATECSNDGRIENTPKPTFVDLSN